MSEAEVSTTSESGGAPGRAPLYLTRQGDLVPAPAGWRPWLLRRLRADMLAKSIFFHGRAGRVFALRSLLREGTLAVAMFRLTNALHRLHLGPVGALIGKVGSVLTGAVIGRRAEIGPGLVILHSHGIVINGTVKAGRNLILGHGVTIGAEKGRTPVLGENVYVGTGAVIVGDVRVGDRARVGANAVVVKDVPDDATAVGVPARVIKTRRAEAPPAGGDGPD